MRALAMAGIAGLLAFIGFRAYAAQGEAAPSSDAGASESGAQVYYAQDTGGPWSDFQDAVRSTIEGIIPGDGGDVQAIASEPNVQAFLRVIRAGEGTAGADGYRTMFGGGLFESYADHPRVAVTAKLGGRLLTSTAAGAYQFLSRTWDEAAAALSLQDFSPASQDAAAVFLIRRRGALADVRAGRFDAAVSKLGREWASLPGSPYGQPTRTIEQARAVYESEGGSYA